MNLYLVLAGIDLRTAARVLRNTPRFFRDVSRYRASQKSEAFPIRRSAYYPILTDFDAPAGAASGHYFHQDLWAARKIFEARPAEHLDVGSRLDGFVAHVLTFMTVQVLDIRALDSRVSGLQFVQGDATEMGGIPDGSIPSLSCLHAIEHFGLGRYGDPVDAEACFRAMAALARVLAPGGRLYFSVPIGVQRVEFNAHRVFAPRTVLDAFPGLELVSFSAVDDAGDFHPDAEPARFESAHFSCGLFEFTKSLDSRPPASALG